jgi:hypothetical protein
MHSRDARVVRESEIMVAAWDGTPGGTAHTVALARAANKPLHIIDPRSFA